MIEKSAMDITIGKNLAKLREKFKLTQREIGQVAGLKRSTYKQYENGYRMIPLCILIELAKFYKVSTDYFFEDMPSLSAKEERELQEYSFSLIKAELSDKYIAITSPAEMKKYFDELQDKIQARARLRTRNLRQENKKTQKELAEYLNIDISTYNKYENGKRNLNNEVIKKIAKFYNIKVADIVD